MSYFNLSNGDKLYYEDKGQGTNTLIMMHGWTSSHDIFVKPVKELQSQARCIIYDHRGHGGSKGANSGDPTMETLMCPMRIETEGLLSSSPFILILFSESSINLLQFPVGIG